MLLLLYLCMCSKFAPLSIGAFNFCTHLFSPIFTSNCFPYIQHLVLLRHLLKWCCGGCFSCILDLPLLLAVFWHSSRTLLLVLTIVIIFMLSHIWFVSVVVLHLKSNYVPYISGVNYFRKIRFYVLLENFLS